MSMLDRDPNAKLEEHLFGATTIWTTRAPMLALEKPDSALALPPGTTLQPKIFVRNTTALPLPANVKLIWRGDSKKGVLALPAIQLQPNETHLIDVSALQQNGQMPKDAHWALVEISAPGKPDDLMAIASSYDSTGRFGAQTPFSDQLDNRWMGGQWEVDATHNSIIAVTNAGKASTTAILTFHYNGGKDTYQIKGAIAAGDQLWLNLGDVIHGGIADDQGRTFPHDLTGGTYELAQPDDGTQPSLFEGKIVVDKTYGRLTYGCLHCCIQTEAQMLANPVNMPIYTADNMYVQALDSCTNEEETISQQYSTWDTNNHAVATMSNTRITADGIGTADPFADGYVMWLSPKYCPQQPSEVASVANVRQVTQSPPIINMSNGDTNVSISVTINGPSGQLVFSTGLTSNLNSSSAASVSVAGSNNASGTANYGISVSGTNSPSGVFGSDACVEGACAAQATTINIPPQILIQMMYAEANGTNSTAMTADGDVVRNRFGSGLFNPPYSTYQNAIVSGQFAFNTSVTTGVQPELNSAVTVFTIAGENFCNSLAFWTPTPTQWTTVQAAINSRTTTFPAGTGAPTYSAWPASQQQILYVSSVGNQGNGAPNFLYLTQRSSTQPAAVNASCTP
jgi:hypothetical protein